MEIFQNPERDYVYSLIHIYYDNPMMTKIKNISDTLSMYAVQIPCLLMNEHRYIIAIIQNDFYPVGHTQYLKDLRWISFMIRSLHDEDLQSLPIHSYTIKRDQRYSLSLTIKSRSNKVSVYSNELEVFEIYLLHTKNQEYEYPNSGSLVSALETFQTMIQFI
jgi:hypothetical protein